MNSDTFVVQYLGQQLRPRLGDQGKVPVVLLEEIVPQAGHASLVLVPVPARREGSGGRMRAVTSSSCACALGLSARACRSFMWHTRVRLLCACVAPLRVVSCRELIVLETLLWCICAFCACCAGCAGLRTPSFVQSGWKRSDRTLMRRRPQRAQKHTAEEAAHHMRRCSETAQGPAHSSHYVRRRLSTRPRTLTDEVA